MRLPLYISVPHAGTRIPPEVQDLCLLSRDDILTDRDTGVDTIYFPLQKYAAGFSTTDIARSLLDLNRAPDDIGGNGVIKEHTCSNVPVYRIFPDKTLVRNLLHRYYFPFHEKLTAGGTDPTIRLGVDCHTMADVGPPVSPDPGRQRPLICLSSGDGSCPKKWISGLADCLAAAFGEPVAHNMPFRGGYICRLHAAEMPWVQVEISQTTAYSTQWKRDCILEGLHDFCQTVLARA